MKRFESLAVLALLAALLLAACGSEPTLPPRTPFPITVAPAADLIQSVSGCTTDVLENWLESTYFLVQDFTTEMNEAATLSQQEVSFRLQRLAILREALLAVPIPEECASDAHRLLVDLTDPVLNGFQAYVDGEGPPPSDAINAANNLLADFDRFQQQLQARLENQFQTPQP
ncbi:MAG: hypothetical protein JW910_13950 [Anaerolineae bacterium]|nr:hypothetical protein [Anaerolineae bacterium]